MRVPDSTTSFSLKKTLLRKGFTIGQEGGLELVVVMPAYNEQANLSAVVREWVQLFYFRGIRFAFLVIDDGSKDQTHAIIQELECEHAEVVGWTKENDGHGPTCRKGYEQAVDTGVPWVLQIDSDGQCTPEFFDAFWNAREGSDLIFGERVSRDDGMARTLTSHACRWATFLWTGVSLRDPNVPYRLMSSEALEGAMKRIPPDFNIYNVALSVAFKRDKQLRWKHLPIHFADRAGGVNSINLRAVARMGFGMLSDLKRIQ